MPSQPADSGNNENQENKNTITVSFVTKNCAGSVISNGEISEIVKQIPKDAKAIIIGGQEDTVVDGHFTNSAKKNVTELAQKGSLLPKATGQPLGFKIHKELRSKTNSFLSYSRGEMGSWAGEKHSTVSQTIITNSHTTQNHLFNHVDAVGSMPDKPGKGGNWSKAEIDGVTLYSVTAHLESKSYEQRFREANKLISEVESDIYRNCKSLREKRIASAITPIIFGGDLNYRFIRDDNQNDAQGKYVSPLDHPKKPMNYFQQNGFSFANPNNDPPQITYSEKGTTDFDASQLQAPDEKRGLDAISGELDMAFYRGPITCAQKEIITSKPEDIVSDHRAVVANFKITRIDSKNTNDKQAVYEASKNDIMLRLDGLLNSIHDASTKNIITEMKTEIEMRKECNKENDHYLDGIFNYCLQTNEQLNAQSLSEAQALDRESKKALSDLKINKERMGHLTIKHQNAIAKHTEATNELNKTRTKNPQDSKEITTTEKKVTELQKIVSQLDEAIKKLALKIKILLNKSSESPTIQEGHTPRSEVKNVNDTNMTGDFIEILENNYQNAPSATLNANPTTNNNKTEATPNKSTPHHSHPHDAWLDKDPNAIRNFHKFANDGPDSFIPQADGHQHGTTGQDVGEQPNKEKSTPGLGSKE